MLLVLIRCEGWVNTSVNGDPKIINTTFGHCVDCGRRRAVIGQTSLPGIVIGSVVPALYAQTAFETIKCSVVQQTRNNRNIIVAMLEIFQ